MSTTPARKPMGIGRRLFLLVAAVGIVVAASFVVNARWATIRNWWFDEDREDSTALAGLATADLRNAPSTPAGGWHQWLGPNRDGVARGPRPCPTPPYATGSLWADSSFPVAASRHRTRSASSRRSCV